MYWYVRVLKRRTCTHNTSCSEIQNILRDAHASTRKPVNPIMRKLKIWFFEGAFSSESVLWFRRLNINRTSRREIAFSCPIYSWWNFHFYRYFQALMSDISLLEDREACEILGTSSSVPATLDNLLHEPADSESGVRSRHGRDRPAESLTRGDRISFSLPCKPSPRP